MGLVGLAKGLVLQLLSLEVARQAVGPGVLEVAQLDRAAADDEVRDGMGGHVDHDPIDGAQPPAVLAEHVLADLEPAHPYDSVTGSAGSARTSIF